MRIWLLNDYNVPPELGSKNRNYHFGLNLKDFGHEPVAFSGSHPHNCDLQLIDGKEKFKQIKQEPFPWVLVKTFNYGNNKKMQILSMFMYYFNVKKASKHFPKPDVIIGSSAHPLAALAAISLGKKYKCKKIVEIRDLWPESIVDYGILPKNHPIVKILRCFELFLYKSADGIFFTQEGAYKYIEEQSWQEKIPQSKVFPLNNGVNVDWFNENKEKNNPQDEDIDNPDIFKVVYTGSIRKANNLSLLLDVAKKVKNPKIKFLVWGDGEELPELKKRVKGENINNVVFKGYTEKKYIPYITSKADLNYAHNNPTPVFRFGISFNKIFDYFAAGKPILCDFPSEYNPVIVNGAGMETVSADTDDIAKKIDEISKMSKEELQVYCDNAKRTAEKYDFKNLTKLMTKYIDKIKDNG